ncbi:hypothetical protein [Shouchella clausii]|uniref:hypothetical protein n=1 Tax=Shouchella clausii TaxID=79880 RepID=UPI000BA7C3C5|nr:hypothetical protein [Shouchella clausii]MBU8597464.1 hypothetical protein [Shouchella clausii]MCY1105126.1 hypothetical protein [Shouchella clausii]MEB5478943.1 hypothetical protein [Shouchella clausii]MED4158966.1 hypothetical protein [Shouchella clausii]MED4176901.1 hypothetical protein [Shouchella clausii]
MTQYIYIASPMKLPQGCYGQKPISKDKPHIFKDELDFTHLFFERNYDNERKKRFAYSQHFSFNVHPKEVSLFNRVKGVAGR